MKNTRYVFDTMRYILGKITNDTPYERTFHVGLLAAALVAHEAESTGQTEPVDAETIERARRAILAWWGVGE